MIRVLWTEMRRGESRWVAAVIAAVGLWHFAGDDAATSDWVGWWAQTAVEVQVFAVMVMGPMTAAAAAWTAGRVHRFRTVAWAEATARGAWSQAVVVWASAMAWTVAAYALLVAVAFGRTAEVSAVTAPVWTPLLLGASVVGLQAAVGVAVGSLVPSRIVAPLVGIGWYGCLVALALTGADGTGFPSALLPAIDEHWDMSFQPRAERLLTATAWCLSAGLSVLALPGLLRRRATRPRVALLLAPVLVAAVSAGLLLTYRPAEPELAWAVRTPQPERPVCTTSGRTTACLWPEDRHLLPVARGAAKAVDAALGSVPGLNRTFYERGLRPEDPATTGELPVMSAGTGQQDMTEQMMSASLPLPPSGCDVPLMKQAGGYPGTFFFEAVVRGRAGAPAPYWGDEFDAALGRFSATPRATQDGWIETAAEAIRACRPMPLLPQAAAARQDAEAPHGTAAGSADGTADGSAP
ncbi:hypothetical protein [Streptomyces sp. TRM49041]|uniref:hypothetical protein n=1 Tax=Streptomyces sp. TRM49041 TaxID=2603216 RepID=UPI0011F065EB|nr:hypothetical protein [Streptomyces sp. TRM49041]